MIESDLFDIIRIKAMPYREKRDLIGERRCLDVLSKDDDIKIRVLAKALLKEEIEEDFKNAGLDLPFGWEPAHIKELAAGLRSPVFSIRVKAKARYRKLTEIL